MVLGLLCSIAQGAVFPAFAVVFGELFDIFFEQTPEEIRNSASIIAAIFVGIAFYNLLFGYLAQMMWGLVGEACSTHYRLAFFSAVLRQNPGFFDSNTVGSLTTMLTTNIENLAKG